MKLFNYILTRKQTSPIALKHVLDLTGIKVNGALSHDSVVVEVEDSCAVAAMVWRFKDLNLTIKPVSSN